MAPLPKQKRIIAFAIKAKRIVQKLFLHAAKKNIALKKAFVRFSSRIPPGSAGNVPLAEELHLPARGLVHHTAGGKLHHTAGGKLRRFF